MKRFDLRIDDFTYELLLLLHKYKHCNKNINKTIIEFIEIGYIEFERLKKGIKDE